ncbi:MAG: NDP-sugar synthase [Vicinamibacterales bacterium]
MPSRQALSSTQPTGIVLAGTHTWASTQFDSLLPRQLVPVAHRPLISYGLSWLEQAGVERVVVCGNRGTGPLRSLLRSHDGFGMQVLYLEDAMPRGAAGCAHDAAAASDGDTFIVTDGTSIPNVELADLLAFHRKSRAAATVVVHDDQHRGVQSGLHTPTGVFVFERRALAAVPPRGFYDIKEHLVPRLRAAGEAVVMFASGRSAPRVLGASTYLAVNEWVVERLVSSRPEADRMAPSRLAWDAPIGYTRIGESLVHSEASVAPDVIITGPVLIAAGARVQSGAVLVGPSSVGRNSVVEKGALVSRSAVWRRAVVGANAVADRTVVADDAVLAADSRAFRTVVRDRNNTRRLL